MPARLALKAIAVGMARRIHRTAALELSAAIRGTVHILPRALEPYYGNTRPLGWLAYLHLRPRAEGLVPASSSEPRLLGSVGRTMLGGERAGRTSSNCFPHGRRQKTRKVEWQARSG